MRSRHDVVIIGGGPAGSACAVQLARAGLDVLLADRFSSRHQIGDALPPRASRILRQLGVLEAFLQAGHIPSFGNTSAWGSTALRSTDFILAPHGHGWHTDRATFDAMLRQAASETGARLCTQCRSIEWGNAPEGCWRICIEETDGSVYDCDTRWLVDATGRSAAVARSEGARRIVHDTLTGFTAFLREHDWSNDRDSLSTIEAVSSGWWYTARLPQRMRMVTYYTDAREPTSTAARTLPGLQSLLASAPHISPRLAGYSFMKAPVVMAANSSRLERPWGEGWIAVGDAAASHDPLSSMGISAALNSGMEAATALLRHFAGDAGAIIRYGSDITAAFEAYRHACARVYAEEHRWTDSQFWATRVSSLEGGFSPTIHNPVISSLR
ncbi:MAG TPA: NAD(P)/FAD-dependent oxidoreductase [Bryobacteraceae bacterium]|nr:NAD(P)/FAD-dependent oxidoreductase [Bryobacteraceae bacterium]